ncbi:hypothetical protein [Pseudomonas sp. SC3(2021)]|uniref:hypothetical protein n=1 Tax=Pseudomonas sp. SC3(2021) TaxID=2871493 RepID=UPI001C9D6A50|nr:hypothetical protein [Pseudomonas sp. SC3(2021)]
MFQLPDCAVLCAGAAEGRDPLILKSKVRSLRGAPAQDGFYIGGNYWLHPFRQQFKVYYPVSFACDYRTQWRFGELTIFRPLPNIGCTLSPDLNHRSQRAKKKHTK